MSIGLLPEPCVSTGTDNLLQFCLPSQLSIIREKKRVSSDVFSLFTDRIADRSEQQARVNDRLGLHRLVHLQMVILLPIHSSGAL
jgi:hypothetical protein